MGWNLLEGEPWWISHHPATHRTNMICRNKTSSIDFIGNLTIQLPGFLVRSLLSCSRQANFHNKTLFFSLLLFIYLFLSYPTLLENFELFQVYVYLQWSHLRIRISNVFIFIFENNTFVTAWIWDASYSHDLDDKSCWKMECWGLMTISNHDSM